MKRFVCFLLVMVMIVGLVPSTVLTARAASKLETSDKAIEILKQFEGFSATAYQDGGKWYIGYGTYVADPSIYVDGITKTEATTLLKNHIHPDNDAANITVDEAINNFAARYNLAFTQYQHDALAIFSYNCGTGWMSVDGAFRSAVINGKTGIEFLNAIALWNGGDPSSEYFGGLINRRLAEANMYLNNSYSRTAPSNYTYVVLDYAGGNVVTDAHGNSIRFYAYDTKVAPAITFRPTRSGYTFLGWTLDSKPVTILDSTVSKKTLVARWQETGTPLTVTSYDINTSQAASLKLYNNYTDLTAAHTLAANSKFTVTKEHVEIKNGSDRVKWVYGKGTNDKGQTVQGWLAMTDLETNSAGDSVIATGTVTATSLSVRDAATSAGAVEGTLKKGDIVQILAYKNEYTAAGTVCWGKIKYNGATGWINMAYVTTRAVSSSDNDSVYGRTGVIANAAKVNVRPGPGVNSGAAITQLAAGTKVTVYETEQVGDGLNAATWGRIKWDGLKEGWVYLYYVKMDDMNLDGTDNAGTGGAEAVLYTGVVTSNTNLNVRSTPEVDYTNKVGSLPTGTKINIYEKTTTNGVEWGRTTNGWVCLQYVSLSAAAGSTGVGSGVTGNGNHSLTTEVGTVTAASLSLRLTATNNSKELDVLSKGDEVTILERVNETTATGTKIWGRVIVDGVEGYINLAYVDVRDVTTIIPDESTSSGSTSTAAKNGVVYNCVSVNIRSNAGVRNTLVTTLPNGTAVKVYEQTEYEGAPWGRIDQGWVCMYYVNLTGTTTDSSTGSSGNASGTVNGTTPGVISATGIVNSNTDLNVRSGAGLAYPKVASLKKGTQVTIYEQVNADGMTWGKTNSGWVCMSYITVNGTVDSGTGVMGTIARCFNAVNVRSAPGTGNALVGTIQVGTRVEIFEQKLYNGAYWGRVSQGWICMEYVALDGEMPPEATEPGQNTEPSTEPGSTTVNGAVNTNASVSFSFTTETLAADVTVYKDATDDSHQAGTVKAGNKLNIVALKYFYNEETKDPEIWGKNEEYGVPGWVNLADVVINLRYYAQVDNVTVYAAGSSSSEDIALLKANAEVYITELWLEGTTVWGKFATSGVNADHVVGTISGLHGWVQMNKMGTTMINVAPTHRSSVDLGASSFPGKTYDTVIAYTDVTATTEAFKFYPGSPVWISSEMTDIIRDHGIVWGRVRANNFNGVEVNGWIDISKVIFQISASVNLSHHNPAIATIPIVENVNLDVTNVPENTNIKGQQAPGSVVIVSLILSDKGELWGQLVSGGWINLRDAGIIS